MGHLPSPGEALCWILNLEVRAVCINRTLANTTFHVFIPYTHHSQNMVYIGLLTARCGEHIL